MSKTAIYGLLGILLVFLFGAVEEVVSNLVIRALGLPESLSIIFAGGVLAIAFAPLHKRLERLVNQMAGEGRSEAPAAD